MCGTTSTQGQNSATKPKDTDKSKYSKSEQLELGSRFKEESTTGLGAAALIAIITVLPAAFMQKLKILEDFRAGSCLRKSRVKKNKELA